MIAPRLQATAPRGAGPAANAVKKWLENNQQPISTSPIAPLRSATDLQQQQPQQTPPPVLGLRQSVFNPAFLRTVAEDKNFQGPVSASADMTAASPLSAKQQSKSSRPTSPSRKNNNKHQNNQLDSAPHSAGYENNSRKTVTFSSSHSNEGGDDVSILEDQPLSFSNNNNDAKSSTPSTPLTASSHKRKTSLPNGAPIVKKIIHAPIEVSTLKQVSDAKAFDISFSPRAEPGSATHNKVNINNRDYSKRLTELDRLQTLFDNLESNAKESNGPAV